MHITSMYAIFYKVVIQAYRKSYIIEMCKYQIATSSSPVFYTNCGVIWLPKSIQSFDLNINDFIF